MNNLDSQSDDYSISKTSLLAVLLYAKGPKGELGEEISGKTRLMKLMFLLLKEANLERYLKESSTFIAYKYGPFDSDIYDSLDALESMGIITIIQKKKEKESIESNRRITEEYDVLTKFKLTLEGIEKTKSIVDKMPPHIYKKIENIKIIYAKKSLMQILRYVYSKFHEYSIHSEAYVYD